MDFTKLLEEEQLREAACLGDLVTLKELISKNVNVNSKNYVNGWTALHWAAYRGNIEAVSILLSNGADRMSATDGGDLPCDLTSSEEVKILLGGRSSKKRQIQLPIIPNYLKNPPLFCQNIDKDVMKYNEYNEGKFQIDSSVNSSEDLVLKLRVAESLDPDFIEIELPKLELSFEKLKEVCCKELHITSNEILKIRKLPNTIIRNDKDVLRLNDFQELEVVKSNSV